MEFVSYLTLLWIEQHLNTCANQSEVRRELERITYECEAEQLIQKMYENRLIPGFHYAPHLVEDMKRAIQFLVDKDDYHERNIIRGKHRRTKKPKRQDDSPNVGDSGIKS